VLCRKYGELDSAGRFCILGTSLGNPNDLALNLLFGAGFLSILLVNSSKLKRLVCGVCILISLYFVLKTGSRANFLTLCFALLVAFKFASARTRMTMAAAGVAVALLMAAAIPKHTWTRLTTFTTASQEELAGDRHLSGAIGSTEARKQLRAVKLTLQYPIFGVGPRMFVYALNDFMKTEGFHKGTWQHPHNTYLDISSETGLVGLGLYVSCILWCLRTNYRSAMACRLRPDLQPAMAQSYCLLFASVVFAFGTLFCSIPYVGQMPFLLGLSAANWLALRDAGAFSAPARLPGFTNRRTVRKPPGNVLTKA
jgi:O-antigen ligase